MLSANGNATQTRLSREKGCMMHLFLQVSAAFVVALTLAAMLRSTVPKPYRGKVERLERQEYAFLGCDLGDWRSGEKECLLKQASLMEQTLFLSSSLHPLSSAASLCGKWLGATSRCLCARPCVPTCLTSRWANLARASSTLEAIREVLLFAFSSAVCQCAPFRRIWLRR